MSYCQNCGIPVIGNYCQNCGQSIAQIPIPRSDQQYQQGYPEITIRNPPRPLPQKALLAMVLSIVVIILLIISSMLAWWSVTVENGIDGKEDYTLKEVKVETDYGDTDYDLDEITDTDFDDVASSTNLLLIIGIIVMIIVIVIFGLFIWYSHNNNHDFSRLFKNLSLIFTFIALIIVIIAPIYYMIAWVEAMDDASDGEYDTFIGSEQINGNDTKWGPGIGWILTIICIPLILINLIIVKFEKDGSREMFERDSMMTQQKVSYQQQVPQKQEQIFKKCINCDIPIPVDITICPACDHNQNRPIPPPP